MKLQHMLNLSDVPISDLNNRIQAFTTLFNMTIEEIEIEIYSHDLIDVKDKECVFLNRPVKLIDKTVVKNRQHYSIKVNLENETCMVCPLGMTLEEVKFYRILDKSERN
jgi:hypothetical protein